MKKLFYVFPAFVSAMLLAGTAKATADADLGIALASTTAILTDNKSQFRLYFVSISVVVLVIIVAKRAIAWGVGKIAGSIGGRRKRR